MKGDVKPQILVVSDPPHGDVDNDAVAEILGLALVDAQQKIGFPAPEVLLASDRDPASDVAEALTRAGLSVAVIDGHSLADIPWPAPISSFDFGGESLLVRLSGDDVEISYDTPVVGVYCKPPSDLAMDDPSGDEVEEGTARLGSGDDGFAIAEGLEWVTNLDLYFTQGGTLRRISIVQDVVDFSGLGGMKRPTGAENMATTIAECERRFHRFELDARLENLRPRHRFLGGDVGFDLDMRKLFSFGTLLLRQVLDSISPEIRDIPQYELGSRLAYLTSRQRGGASI